MNSKPSQQPLIQDIPSIRKNLENARNFKHLKAAMPLLRPILALLGAKVDEMGNALSNIDKLVEDMEELATIPDRFNDLFATRGWIIYGLMNIEMAKTAISQAEVGNLDGAEQALVNYYTPETVKWLLRTMDGIQAFRPRMRLAQLALIDYQEGRYHACIPVVLALMDGLVNELHRPKQGFFASGVNLEAWDSIAAHSKGLQVLSGLLGKGRDKTREERLTIPYRNGILHGTDLGYDNQMVAAKTWAALFAVSDWAVKAERGELTAPPDPPKKSLSETIQQLQAIEADKKRVASWKPRGIQVGVEVPATGVPEDYESGTPERQLIEYLSWWHMRNYGYMARYLSKSWGYPANEAPARIREQLGSKHLLSYEIISITDEVPAITVIEIKLIYEESGQKVEKITRARMMNESAKGGPAVAGQPGSTWVVLTWGLV